MKKQIVIALGMFFLVGCMHGEKIRDIHPGMSVDELYAQMGPHEGYKKSGVTEVYSYYNKLVSGWGWDRASLPFLSKTPFYFSGTINNTPVVWFCLISPAPYSTSFPSLKI